VASATHAHNANQFLVDLLELTNEDATAAHPSVQKAPGWGGRWPDRTRQHRHTGRCWRPMGPL